MSHHQLSQTTKSALYTMTLLIGISTFSLAYVFPTNSLNFATASTSSTSSTSLIPAASAANQDGVYSLSTQKTASSILGVDTVPTCVIVDNVRHNGIYISGTPASELATQMKLAQGMVLLTLDGYSITSSSIADSWLKHRPAGKNLVFTYAIAVGGKPKIYTGQIQPTPTATGGSSASVNISSRPAIGMGGKPLGIKEVSDAEIATYAQSLINGSRAKASLSPVQLDTSLGKFASEYADYMAKNRDQYEASSTRNPHDDLSGRGPKERAASAGMNGFLQESIGRASRARNDLSSVSILHQEMMAGNHRMIILNPEATLVGVGVARLADRFYLVEEFGK